MKRPAAVTLLAVLNGIGGLFMLAFAALLGVGVATSGAAQDPGAGVVFGVLAGIVGVIGVFYLVTAVGLWTLKGYGRVCQLILAGIGLLGFPIGTIVSAVILYYMTRPGVALLFSGRSGASLTPDEHALIARDANQSAILVVVVVVALLGGVAVTGIVAAIAVPALLRARISANEASTIGTLRTVVSAEVSWFSSHGAYAAPGCLQDPASCGKDATSKMLDADPTAVAARSGYRYGFVLRPATAPEPEPEQPTVHDPAAPSVENMTPEELARHLTELEARSQAAAAARTPADPGGFVLWAVPERPGSTGTRSFCVDEQGAIYEYGVETSWTDPSQADPRCPGQGQPIG